MWWLNFYFCYCYSMFTISCTWSITTGNRASAECKLLCRVSKIRHSVKNCTRQRILCRVPGTRQKRALGKGLLCQVLSYRQKLGTRYRLPRVTVFGHVLLCRVAAVRRSAKIFFRKYFAECPWHGARQRFNIFLNAFAECPLIQHSTNIEI